MKIKVEPTSYKDLRWIPDRLMIMYIAAYSAFCFYASLMSFIFIPEHRNRSFLGMIAGPVIGYAFYGFICCIDGVTISFGKHEIKRPK